MAAHVAVEPSYPPPEPCARTDDARQSIDSHKNRYLAHLFPASYDYYEFVTIFGRLMQLALLFGLRIAAAGTMISTMQV
jgi:hypothetical protein